MAGATLLDVAQETQQVNSGVFQGFFIGLQAERSRGMLYPGSLQGEPFALPPNVGFIMEYLGFWGSAIRAHDTLFSPLLPHSTLCA